MQPNDGGKTVLCLTEDEKISHCTATTSSGRAGGRAGAKE
jgi:hypothetical protein